MFDEPIRGAAEALLATCRRKKLMLATAESCTGGLVAGALTEIAGSSDVVDRGFVTYSNEAKQQMLGVSPTTLRDYGAVSRQTAEEMARGAIAHSNAQLAVAITGIAGPGGGSAEKPVGLVWLSVAAPGEGGAPARLTRSVNLPGGRADIRDRATTVAMHLLRRLLDGR